MSGVVADKGAFSPTEAAEWLGISRSSIFELLASGEIPSLKLGARRLIRREALVDFLDRLEQAS